MAEIGNVTVRVDAVITDEQYHEAMSAVSAAKERMAELQAENAKLKALCEWLLEPYRLGAITGEGVDKQWCRETYDGGSYRLHELGKEVAL